MDLEIIRAQLVADTQPFVAGLERAGGALGTMGQRAQTSSRGLTVIRGAMVGLAAQATGAAGPVGRLAQGLLLLGGGSTAVLGAAAGIGALALAYNELTKETREAKKAQEDMIESLKGIGVHAELTAARIKLAALQSEVGTHLKPSFLSSLLFFVTGGQGKPKLETDVTAEQQLLSQIATVQNEIARLVEREAAWRHDVAEATERAARAELERVRHLKEAVDLEGPLPAKFLNAPGGKSLITKTENLAFLQKEVFGIVGSDMQERVRDLGISLGRQLMLGMVEGIDSLRDVLRAVLMAILDFGITSFLESILPVPGLVSGKGPIPGKSPAVGPAQFHGTMQMSGLQPVTAYFVARDPAFQQLLREGILVAGAEGFRHG